MVPRIRFAERDPREGVGVRIVIEGGANSCNDLHSTFEARMEPEGARAFQSNPSPLPLKPRP